MFEPCLSISFCPLMIHRDFCDVEQLPVCCLALSLHNVIFSFSFRYPTSGYIRRGLSTGTFPKTPALGTKWQLIAGLFLVLYFLISHWSYFFLIVLWCVEMSWCTLCRLVLYCPTLRCVVLCCCAALSYLISFVDLSYLVMCVVLPMGLLCLIFWLVLFCLF